MIRHRRPWKLPVDLGGLIFPVRCLNCGIPLFERYLPACPICLSHLEYAGDSPLVRQYILQHDNRPSAPGLPPVQHVYAHWMFDKTGLVQKLHRELKYNNRPSYGLELGRIVASGFLKAIDDRPLPDCIIPIPLHSTRYLERGYNQSLMLAKGFEERIQRPIATDCLIRKKPTRSQTGLNANSRMQNVRAAFSIKTAGALKGKHVVLIDDVLTTGATLTAAAATLGRAHVDRTSMAVMAFARPVSPGRFVRVTEENLLR